MTIPVTAQAEVLLALSLGCLLYSPQSWAADQSSTEPVALQEVIVTANRAGAEDLQKVPTSISALDASALENQGLNSLMDITWSVPGISVQELGGGQNTIVIRGITTDGTSQNADIETQSPVSVYVDDMPISLAGYTPDLRVFDLERVEVVRGPQGTLYGAGAMAGNIRYVTRKPDATQFDAMFEAGSDVSRGDFGYIARGMVNAPLIDNLLGLRVSIFQGQDPGYIDNIATNTDNANKQYNTQVRAALRLQSIDNWTIDASWLLGRVRVGNSNGAYSELGDYQYSALTPERYFDRYQFWNLTAQYSGQAFDFISSTSLVDRHIDNPASAEFGTAFFTSFFPGGPIDVASYSDIRNDTKDFSQEFRVSSKSWTHFRGQIGAFYERQTRDYWQNFPTPGWDALSGLSGIPPSESLGGFTPDTLFSETQSSTTRQLAFFGELKFSPTDRWDFIAGLRQFNWRQSFNLYSAAFFGVNPATFEPLTTSGDSNESGVNPRANVTFHLTPDAMIYAEAAKGFRYGGLNQPAPLGPPPGCANQLAAAGLTSVPPTFGPDHLWTYSLGEKAALFEHRLNLDVTGFWTKWSDVQTRHNLTDPVDGSCGYYYIRNKGDVTSSGVELEAQWQATAGLQVGVSAALTDARTNGPIEDLGAPDGARAPYFPRVMASLNASYKWPVPIGLVTLQGDYTHRGNETTTFATTDPLYRIIPSFDLINAALVLNTGRFEWRLYGRNLTDKRIIVANLGNTSPGFQPGDLLYLGRPLTIGVSVAVRFGAQ